MKSPRSLILAALGCGVCFNVLAASEAPNSAAAARLLRGEYLVEKIGLCADCHSPRNQRGEFIRESYLGGAPLPFAPTVPMPAWGATAPAIAGLPSMDDAQAVTFLTTGIRPDGSLPRPPMPAFRFSEEDARAVVAYLRAMAPKK